MEACPTQLAVLKDLLLIFAQSTGLRVNYNKYVMVPLNISEAKLDQIATLLNYQKGTLPFTYLGLPLRTTKPNIEDFLPLIQRIERRLTCTFAFLSQGGKLEMVNTVSSSSMVFYIFSMKLHKGVIKQLDKYRKHCLWRGADLNSRKLPKAAWPMVCLPKDGGLGVIDLTTHNNALLLKFLHKFYMRMNLPWVKLIWDAYYNDDSLPGQKKRRSFWWRDIVKLLDTYKSLASVKVAEGTTVLFWTDSWNGQTLASACPELYSFAKNKGISFKKALSRPQLIQNFHLPLTIQAHQQFQGLIINLHQLQPQGDREQWLYVWGSPVFTASWAYKEIMGHRAVHSLFLAISKSKC